jgi:hypothetical protein
MRIKPWLQWPRGWQVLSVALAGYALAMAVVVVVRAADVPPDAVDYDEVRAETTLDFRDYWFTARTLQRTGQVTTDYGVHNYVPFFTILMLPLSFLPLVVAAPLFVIGSLGLLFAALLLADFMLNQEISPQPRPALLVTLGLLLPYLTSAAVLGAVDLLLVGLILLTWILFEQRQEWAAGVLLGLAALIKVVPLVLLGVFVLQRRWRVVGGSAATLVFGLVLIPCVVLGWEQTRDEYTRYYEEAVQEHSARATLTADEPRKAKYSNNALPIVLRRLLTPTDGDPQEEEDHPGLFVNIANLNPTLVFWLYVVLVGGGIAITAGLSWPRPDRWPPVFAHEIQRLRLQFGLWCLLALWLTPLLWTRYLLLAAWPLLVVAHWTERAERRSERAYRGGQVALVGWLVCAALLVSPAARAAGAQLAAVVVLGMAVAWLLARRRPASDTTATTS